MRRALANSPLDHRERPAAFSLLETIASAEERRILAFQEKGLPPVMPCTMWKSIFEKMMRFATALCASCKVTFSKKSATRQMHVVEQLVVARGVTLVLVEVAGERLLLSLHSGAPATVTPLATTQLSVGPQRLESMR